MVRELTANAMPFIIAPPQESPPQQLAPRDADQRLSSGVMFAREMDVDLPREQRIAALAAAARRVTRLPSSASGWLTLGYLQLDLGDFGGALVTLERAAALYPPFEARRPTDTCWAHVYAALAHGALREWVAVAEQVKRAAELGFWYSKRLSDSRLSPDRSAAMLPALEPYVEKVQKNDTVPTRRRR